MSSDRPGNPEDSHLREVRSRLSQHLEREVALGKFTSAELAALDRQDITADFK